MRAYKWPQGSFAVGWGFFWCVADLARISHQVVVLNRPGIAGGSPESPGRFRVRVTTVEDEKIEMLVVRATHDSLVGDTPDEQIQLASSDIREVWKDKGRVGEVIYWSAILAGLVIFILIPLSDFG